MLNLRILTGPLRCQEDVTILEQFNRLTGAQISLDNFRRWTQSGCDGPACHGILETDDSNIVGHFSLIPLRATFENKQIRLCRTEYFFVHEKFRSEKVRGFEKSFASAAIVLLDQLYRYAQNLDWGPVIVSASDEIQPFHRLVGCKPVEFPLTECLLVLKPLQAARQTANLSNKQRAAVFGVGLAQKALWGGASLMFSVSQDIHSVASAEIKAKVDADRITLFPDKESFRWRYPSAEYALIAFNSCGSNYLIAKAGSDHQYLRICDWSWDVHNVGLDLILALVRKAQTEGALGIRWAIYGCGENSKATIRKLKKLGFVCVPRVRKLLLRTKDPFFLTASNWKLTDSLFSFDL